MGSRIEHRAEFSADVASTYAAVAGEDALRARLEQLGGHSAELLAYEVSGTDLRYELRQGISADKMDSVISRQLDSIRANGISPDELAKARNFLRAATISGRETTLGKAEDLQHYNLFHAAIGEINTDLDRLMAVTAEDVKRVANTYLAPGNLTLIVVRAGSGPQAGGGQ